MTLTGSLVVVGAGINVPTHTTLEAIYWIRNSSKIFYLLNTDAGSEWIGKLKPEAEDLAPFYSQETDRIAVYARMVAHIVDAIKAGQKVCVVFYGHPNVYVLPTRDLMDQAAQHGFAVKVCPGISAEDCLFADLGIDPARTGCQSYDATDFLIRSRRFDSNAGLVLWQIGVIGNLTSTLGENAHGLAVLKEVLSQHYPITHVAYVYEAAAELEQSSTVQPIAIGELEKARITAISTLYVPPISIAEIDRGMLERLGIADKFDNA